MYSPLTLVVAHDKLRCGLRANEDSKEAFQNDRVIERLFMTEFSIHYLISLRQVSDIRKLSGSAKLVASPTLELARLIGVVRFTVDFGRRRRF